MTKNKEFLEMKIMFTIKDLTNYYYRKTQIDALLTDYKRDEGAFNYLLNKYSRIDFIESLDFVMSLIDIMSMNKDTTTSVFDLSKYETENLEYLKSVTAEAKLLKANRIIWRWSDD